MSNDIKEIYALMTSTESTEIMIDSQIILAVLNEESIKLKSNLVVASDGFTYASSKIEKIILGDQKSLHTNDKISVIYFENKLINELIEKINNKENIYSSIFESSITLDIPRIPIICNSGINFDLTEILGCKNILNLKWIDTEIMYPNYLLTKILARLGLIEQSNHIELSDLLKIIKTEWFDLIGLYDYNKFDLEKLNENKFRFSAENLRYLFKCEPVVINIIDSYVNSGDKINKTFNNINLLNYVSYYSSDLCIKRLLDLAISDIAYRDGHGRTSLCCYLSRPDEILSFEIVKLFIDKGSPITSIDKDNKTIVHVCCMHNRYEILLKIKKYIDIDAIINITDDNKNSALYYCKMTPNVLNFFTLLNSTIDDNIFDLNCYHFSSEIITYMINNRLDIVSRCLGKINKFSGSICNIIYCINNKNKYLIKLIADSVINVDLSAITTGDNDLLCVIVNKCPKLLLQYLEWILKIKQFNVITNDFMKLITKKLDKSIAGKVLLTLTEKYFQCISRCYYSGSYGLEIDAIEKFSKDNLPLLPMFINKLLDENSDKFFSYDYGKKNKNLILYLCRYSNNIDTLRYIKTHSPNKFFELMLEDTNSNNGFIALLNNDCAGNIELLLDCMIHYTENNDRKKIANLVSNVNIFNNFVSYLLSHNKFSVVLNYVMNNYKTEFIGYITRNSAVLQNLKKLIVRYNNNDGGKLLNDILSNSSFYCTVTVKKTRNNSDSDDFDDSDDDCDGDSEIKTREKNLIIAAAHNNKYLKQYADNIVSLINARINIVV
jgi:hypothetical protein